MLKSKGELIYVPTALKVRFITATPHKVNEVGEILGRRNVEVVGFARN